MLWYVLFVSWAVLTPFSDYSFLTVKLFGLNVLFIAYALSYNLIGSLYRKIPLFISKTFSSH